MNISKERLSLELNFLQNGKALFALLFLLFSSLCINAQENNGNNGNNEDRVVNPGNPNEIVIEPHYFNARLTVTVTEGLNNSDDVLRINEGLKKLGLFEEVFVALDRKQVELKLAKSSFGLSRAEVFKAFMLVKCKIDKNILVIAED